MAVAENQPPKNRMDNFARILEFGERMRARITRAGVVPIADAEFTELANQLFRLQATAIPVLKSLATRRELNLDETVSWQRLPAIPTAMFKELELSSIPPERRSTFFLSSGTTAKNRSRHWHGAESLALYEESLRRWFAANVRLSGHAFISLTPPAAAVPNSSLVHMFEQYRSGLGADVDVFLGELSIDGAWEVRFDELFSRLEHLSGPVFLVGTAFSFVHVLDEMKTRQLKFALPAGSLLLETGGYKGRSRVLTKAQLYRRLQSRFGVPDEAIVCEYGMSELSSQAYDAGSGTAGEGRVFRFPSWARVVIVSPETGEEVAEGEVGLLRIVDLANTFSVMAVQTEDLVVRVADGFELLGRPTEAEPRGCSLMAA
jgi:hypothetical protein